MSFSLFDGVAGASASTFGALSTGLGGGEDSTEGMEGGEKSPPIRAM
jgi:hypothetical protein